MAKQVKLNLHDMSDADLKSKLAEDKTRLQRLHFNHTVTPLENPMVMRHLRREIATMTHETANRAKKSTIK